MECLRSITIQASRLSIPAAARSLNASLFPLRLHPLHATLQEQLCEWVKDHFGHLLSDAEMQKIRRVNYGWLACSFWSASVNPKRSLTLLKLMFWFIVFDDAIDNSISMSRDANAAHAYCCYLLQTLFGNASHKEVAAAPSPSPIDEHVPLRTLSSNNVDIKTRYSERELLPIILGLEWWGEMKRDGMPIKQQARFATAITDYVMSQVSIVRFNELMDAEAPPSLHDFVPIRRVAIGAPLCFLASEYDLGIDLDEETLGDPCVQQLHDAASDHVAWINDILSFTKEFSRGDFLNLLSLLHIQNNKNNCKSFTPFPNCIPFEVAAAQAWEMTIARQRDCARLAMEIMKSPHLASNVNMQRYVDGVCSITTGNWAWSINCSRYNASAVPVLSTSPTLELATDITV